MSDPKIKESSIFTVLVDKWMRDSFNYECFSAFPKRLLGLSSPGRIKEIHYQRRLKDQAISFRTAF